MTGLDVVLFVVGLGITAIVVAAMFLIAPRGFVPVHREGDEREESNLSPTSAPADPPRARPTAT